MGRQHQRGRERAHQRLGDRRRLPLPNRVAAGFRQRAADWGCRRMNSLKAINRGVASNGQLFILPDDILQNTVRAFQRERNPAKRLRGAGRADRPLPGAGEMDPTASRRRPGTGDGGVRSLDCQRTAASCGSTSSGPSRPDPSGCKAPRRSSFRVEMLNALNKAVLQPGVRCGACRSASRPRTTGPGGPGGGGGTPTSNTDRRRPTSTTTA